MLVLTFLSLQITQPESTVGDDVWLARKRGLPGVQAHGVGKSATQYDGYKYLLDAQNQANAKQA